MNSKTKNKAAVPPLQEEEVAEIEKNRACRGRARKLVTAHELAARMKVLPDGSRTFIRFNKGERNQHMILIVSFTTLGITGLLQTFSRIGLIGWLINVLLGGVETLRTVHHLAAIVFGIQSIYHLGEILYLWFVKREFGSMWPSQDDLKGLVGMLRFNLNKAKARPLFDRFTFEEKVEYWALLWGTAIMGITGVFQWFPLFVTSVMPGVAIPIARSIHAWEAVLAVLSILTWHLYHTVVKESNQSIFTGEMSEEEMHELHTLEYRRILAAVDYIEKYSLQHQKEKAGTVAAASHEEIELGTTD